MVISLLGYMGVGKSSIGKKLAQSLGLTFIDLDDYITQKENLSISEIFKAKGEIYFRKKENEYLSQFFNETPNAILSTGGGTPVYYNNLALINQFSFSIYLRAKPSTLANRIYPNKNNRPLVAHLEKDHLPEFIAKHLFERKNFYEKAQLTISTDDKSIDEIVSIIIHEIKNHQNLS